MSMKKYVIFDHSSKNTKYIIILCQVLLLLFKQPIWVIKSFIFYVSHTHYEQVSYSFKCKDHFKGRIHSSIKLKLSSFMKIFLNVKYLFTFPNMKGKKYSFKCVFEGVCGMMRSLKSNINVIILKIQVRLFYQGCQV